MTASALRHLVAVWNPSYAESAMDEHVRVLRAWAGKHRAGEIGDDEVYVWWGKVKSANRQQPMKHLGEVRAVTDAIGDDDEAHLYLTDYRALYVAELLDVTDGTLPAGEKAHAPAYYEDRELTCDLWFRLGDIRRIVVDDTLAVVEELQKLRNVHYNDRPVSIYGGMVDLPLVVTRPDGARFFDPDERTALAGDQLWVEFDAESGAGVGAIERDLRENRIGETLWSALEPAARTFSATGEKLFREHRLDPAFDFAPVLTSFAKAIEVQVNATLQRTLAKIEPRVRQVNIDGRSEDLFGKRSLGLGELARAIGGERELNQALASLLDNGRWFTQEMPPMLDDLRAVRNPGAHASMIDRATARRWRERIVGVGCAGLLVELARTKVKR